jgi:hypothetical protein
MFTENRNVGRATHQDFLAWFKNNKSQHLGCDIIDGYRISTLFLSEDYGVSGYEAPLLFETIISNSLDEIISTYRQRCNSKKDAEEMHRKAVEFVNSRYRTRL